MGIWSYFLEMLQSGLFTTTQLCGGNLGSGILAFSLVLRLALLPLTYSLARRSRQRRFRMKQLEPQLVLIRKRHQDDPLGLMQETARLYRRHNIDMFDSRSFLGSFVQLPFFAGMYTVIRRVLASGTGGPFLWISDITKADVWLAVLVSALTYGATVLNPTITQQAPQWLAVVSAAVTMFILLKLSAGIGIYWAASSAISGVQAIMLRRTQTA